MAGGGAELDDARRHRCGCPAGTTRDTDKSHGAGLALHGARPNGAAAVSHPAAALASSSTGAARLRARAHRITV
ncbi:hypothetical protein BE20_28605 [Sorangium cellulosum]|nr:hypothetical protein BE20_28605 [Sorangium cellulosum]